MGPKRQVAEPRSGRWALDTIGAWVVLALAVSFLSVRVFVHASSVYLTTVPLVLGVSSGLYLLSKRTGYPDTRLDDLRVSPRVAHALRQTTVVGIAAMVFVGALTGGRTVAFFVVAALVGAVLFAQIFVNPRAELRPTAVLAQVVAYALVVRGVALVTTPGLIGVDAWVHLTDYAHSIQQAGRLEAIADVKYFGAPLYHLLVVVAADLFDTTLETALYATLGVVVPLSLLLVYFSSRYLLSARWSLFAVAVYGVTDHFVRWGIHLIPNSMGLVLFIGVCYGIAKMWATRPSAALYGLTLLFAIATILTHQVSTFVLLVVLALGIVVQVAVELSDSVGAAPGGHADGVTTNFVALFVVLATLTAVNWYQSPVGTSSFVSTMLGNSIQGLNDPGLFDIPSATAVSTAPIRSLTVSVPYVYQLVDALGFMVVLLVALVGAFTVFQRRNLESLSLLWVLSAGVMLVVTLGLPLVGLYFLLPDRWFAFMYVPLVVLGAYGLRHLALTLPGREVLAILLVVALVLPGAMLVSDVATRENPLDERYSSQIAFSESELDAAETIGTIHPDDAVLATDQRYRLLFRDWQGETTGALSLTGNETTTDRYTVYRRAQTVGGPKMDYRGSLVRAEVPPDVVCRPSMDVVYANGAVRYCRGGGPR
jgi:hypothetical protein